MRPDILLVATQGVRGGKIHSNIQGNCRIKVTKGYNEPANTIWVDVFEGAGHTYKQAEKAKINVSFADGKQWDGNFDSLKDKLMGKELPKLTLKIANSRGKRPVMTDIKKARNIIAGLMTELNDSEGKDALKECDRKLWAILHDND